MVILEGSDERNMKSEKEKKAREKIDGYMAFLFHFFIGRCEVKE